MIKKTIYDDFESVPYNGEDADEIERALKKSGLDTDDSIIDISVIDFPEYRRIIIRASRFDCRIDKLEYFAVVKNEFGWAILYPPQMRNSNFPTFDECLKTYLKDVFEWYQNEAYWCYRRMFEIEQYMKSLTK
jgi:hypothetical protein